MTVARAVVRWAVVRWTVVPWAVSCGLWHVDKTTNHGTTGYSLQSTEPPNHRLQSTGYGTTEPQATGYGTTAHVTTDRPRKIKNPARAGNFLLFFALVQSFHQSGFLSGRGILFENAFLSGFVDFFDRVFDQLFGSRFFELDGFAALLDQSFNSVSNGVIADRSFLAFSQVLFGMMFSWHIWVKMIIEFRIMI